MSQCRTLAASVVFVVVVLAWTGLARAEETPLDSVPSPGKLVKESLTLVGLSEDQKVAIAVRITFDDSAAAYICDGKELAVWFQGPYKLETDLISLKNAEGDTLTASWPKQGAMTAQASVGGKTLKFTLEASQVGGLAREVETVDGEKHVSGWIFTNDGRVIGARTARRKVVRGLNSRTGTAGQNVGGQTGGSGGPPADAVARTLRARCKALTFRINAASVQAGTLNNPTSQRLIQRSRELGCDAASAN